MSSVSFMFYRRCVIDFKKRFLDFNPFETGRCPWSNCNSSFVQAVFRISLATFLRISGDLYRKYRHRVFLKTIKLIVNAERISTYREKQNNAVATAMDLNGSNICLIKKVVSTKNVQHTFTYLSAPYFGEFRCAFIVRPK